jgi:rhodanese-related sulfurtransferase
MPTLPSGGGLVTFAVWEMKKALFEAIVVVILAATLALAINGLRPSGVRLVRRPPPAAIPYQAPQPLIGTIRPEDALRKLVDDKALIVDARSEGEYTAGHVEGALSLPLSSFEQGIDAFLEVVEPGLEIIVYCSSAQCPQARELAEHFLDLGFDNLVVMVDGWEKWQAMGLPSAVGPP